jgi:hypothetical protein
MIEAVCQRYGVDRGHRAARGSRSLAGAALADLAKQHEDCTRAVLVPILGLSSPESVPNHSARIASLIANEATSRRDLTALELSPGLRELTS